LFEQRGLAGRFATLPFFAKMNWAGGRFGALGGASFSTCDDCSRGDRLMNATTPAKILVIRPAAPAMRCVAA